jgi:hypothetical protein
MNPESDSVYYPKTSGLARANAEAGCDVRPLEAVAAVTYAQAREYAEAIEKEYSGLPRVPAMSDVGKATTDLKKKTD